MANPGDQTSDGSIVWPANRKVVELGTIALTAIAVALLAVREGLVPVGS